MKQHIHRITSVNTKATVFEDVLCQLAQVVSLILRAVGGAAPIADIAEEKCIFSPPPSSGGGEA